LTGHFSVAHFIVSFRSPQAEPLLPGARTTFLSLVLTAPPQVCGQRLHRPQFDKIQSPALHGLELQGRICDSIPHILPAPFLGDATFRVRICVPPPHEWVQVDQFPHGPGLQLTGHVCMKHADVWFRVGHFLLLCCGMTSTIRKRVLLP